MEFLVSWSGFNGGNKSFATREELDKYVEANYRNWRTYSRWMFTPNQMGVSELHPILD